MIEESSFNLKEKEVKSIGIYVGMSNKVKLVKVAHLVGVKCYEHV